MSELNLLTELQLHDLELQVKDVNAIQSEIDLLDEAINKIKSLISSIQSIQFESGCDFDFPMPERICISKADAVNYSLPVVPSFVSIQPNLVPFLIMITVIVLLPLK
jgi:hypothetical protein